VVLGFTASSPTHFARWRALRSNSRDEVRAGGALRALAVKPALLGVA
jgi:hypothetical protein